MPARNQMSDLSRPVFAPRTIGSAHTGIGDVERAPDVDAVELRRRDADDVETVTVEQQRTADRRRVTRHTHAARTRGRVPMAGAHPFTSSDGPNSRPAAGRTPSVEKKLPLTNKACAGRRSPPCARSNDMPPQAMKSVNTCCCSLILQIERIDQHRPRAEERPRAAVRAP